MVAQHIAEVGHPGGAGLCIDAHLDHASRAIVDPCDGAHAQQRASPVGSAGSARQKQEQHQGWALERMRTVGPLTVRDDTAALGVFGVSANTALRGRRDLVFRSLVHASGATNDHRAALRVDASSS